MVNGKRGAEDLKQGQYSQRRSQPYSAPNIEIHQRDASVTVDFAQQNCRDQIPAKHKENIDPDPAAG
jgi:hypothetical protein